MALIPIAKIIIKLSLCLGPILLGIRCLFVTEPKTDNFVYDVRNMLPMRGMSSQKWWIKRGIFLIIVGLIFSILLFAVPALKA